MPEGVEVKLSGELIKPLVVGKQIKKVALGDHSRYAGQPPKGFDEFKKSFIKEGDGLNIIDDCKIVDVQVKGKFMYWTFSNGWYMFCTFGMTGQWSPKAGKHVCYELKLVDYTVPKSEDAHSDVYFNDPRHFGTLQFTNDKKVLSSKLDELGWDPLRMDLQKNLPWLKLQLSKTSKPVGEVMMDQGVFAGVGNYIRAEALYLSKLSPFRTAKSLNDNEIQKLCQSIIDVMEESYKHQGATISTYKTVYGEEGKYSGLFKVYGQKQDPLGNKIVKQDSGGRTIHWCPTVQA